MEDRFWVEEDDDSSVSPVRTPRGGVADSVNETINVGNGDLRKRYTADEKLSQRDISAARFVIEEDEEEETSTSSRFIIEADDDSAAPSRGLSKQRSGSGVENRFIISDAEPEEEAKPPKTRSPKVVHRDLSRTQCERSSSSLSSMNQDITMPQLWKEVRRISLQNHKLHSMLDKLLVASGEASTKAPEDKRCPVSEAQKNMKGLLADLGKGGHELINECVALKKRNGKLEAQLKESRAKIRSLTAMVENLKGGAK